MTQKNRVVTITLNPAYDMTGALADLKLGQVNQIQTGQINPAGKGINVARVLSDLGAQVTVTGFLGADNSASFEQFFQDINAQDQFVRIPGVTRTNVKLVEKNKRVSDINFPGINVTTDDVDKLEITLFKLAKTHDYFVLAGSIPPGFPPERCAAWIEKLQRLGKKVFFDSSSDALKAGIVSEPWFIKPNIDELSQLMGQQFNSVEECCSVLTSPDLINIENIVVSLGEQGVIWLNQGQILRAVPPKMNVISTVGAGDTFVAGFCWGVMQDMPKHDLLRFATALSALAVTKINVGLDNSKTRSQIEGKTTVTEYDIACHQLNPDKRGEIR